MAYHKTYRLENEPNAKEAITYDHSEGALHADHSVQGFQISCAPLRLQSREMQPMGGARISNVCTDLHFQAYVTGRSGVRTHARIYMWST